ncbi:hypothetical protein TNCV_4421351 [Trichonephila clavipes]|nr:hypothetical protein TNCV_4421351 [Trichonephila clavipes]
MSERFGHLIELSTSLYNIEYETSLVRDYIERLNKVRLKQEVIAEKDSALIAEELDELNITAHSELATRVVQNQINRFLRTSQQHLSVSESPLNLEVTPDAPTIDTERRK